MSPTNEHRSLSAVQPVIPSSSDTSLNAMLGIPMPTPGMPGAPKFKGKHVSDFLDALEQHADSAQISHTLSPGYILRYCHSKVRMVIGLSLLLSGDDWVAVRVYLDNLYLLTWLLIKCGLMKFIFVFTEEFRHRCILKSRNVYQPRTSRLPHLQRLQCSSAC